MNTLKNMTRIALSLSLLGLAATGPSYAATTDYRGVDAYNPSWYIAPSVNGIDPDSRFGIDHRGEGVGLRLGVPVSPEWDIQFGPTFSRARNGSLHYRQNTLGVDGLYLFSRDVFRPFVLIGAGAEYDKVNTPFIAARRTSPYVNAGLGFQYGWGDQWGMQMDLRRAYGYLRGDDFPFRRAHTNILTLGLTYAFDKPPRAAPMAQAAPPAVMAPVAVAAPPPPPPPPAPPPRFERYRLSSTELFPFDSAELSLPQPKLDELVTALARNPQVGHVVIAGYTDRLGSDDYNQALSQRRAEAVKTYLINRNVAADRLSAEGRGESNPVVECNDTKRADLIVCLETNRRVEVEELTFERRIP
ncbi:OmpA family protein [Chitinimonas sp. BJYL2]|uniref:OmpA family protein n=1 Tax=Chitinimonas sp. BJYL2 TaxID=2976696 RepID=UPI0022B34B24|nr:OmpA family protein [Chitinimonas sp. BJYL2]